MKVRDPQSAAPHVNIYFFFFFFFFYFLYTPFIDSLIFDSFFRCANFRNEISTRLED